MAYKIVDNVDKIVYGQKQNELSTELSTKHMYLSPISTKKVCRKIKGLRMVFCIIPKVMHKLSTIWG